MRKMTKVYVMLPIAVLLSAGLGIAGLFEKETVGERFRKALKKIEAACGKRKLEPNEVCGAVAKLKPADPFATEEGRFAHSIKIPNPVSADSVYKPGMTSREYFDHLCKTEAGEFIYKTVENVEGIYMMRPRESAKNDDLMQHLYAMEDPYGLAVGVRDSPQDQFVQPPVGKYQYFEVPVLQSAKTGEGQKYRRYYRDEQAHPGSQFPTSINGQFVQVPYVVAMINVPKPQSRHGYTWRGISRPHDRELGIAGGELIVLDLDRNEVLAVRRSFVRSGSVRNNLTGVWWLTAGKCSKESLKTDAQFINEVLKPIPSKQEKLDESK